MLRYYRVKGVSICSGKPATMWLATLSDDHVTELVAFDMDEEKVERITAEQFVREAMETTERHSGIDK